MSHGTSRKWISDSSKQYETYKKVSGHFRHIAPKSPALPSSFKAWLAHQEAMVEQAKAAIQQEIQREIDRLSSGGWEIKRNDPKPAFDVTKFNDGRSSVLAMQSIWVSRDIEPANPHAPWPTNAELKHNGVYRITAGGRRAVPHPREHVEDPKVRWDEKPLVAFFPFDNTTLNEGGNDTVEVTDGESHLGLELLKELDR